MTQAAHATAPLAQTLDDATLRQVFPGCPECIDVPRDVGSLFKARMRSVGGERRRAWLLAWGGLLLVGCVLLLAGSVVLGGIAAGGAAVFAIVVAAMQYSRAGNDFFTRYAEARGLTYEQKTSAYAAVPLFRSGDEREWPRVLRGTIAGQSASLGHFTYTTVTHDSEGDRQEQDHHFTFLHFRLPDAVAARFAGVYLSPKQLTFGKLQDKVAHDRGVQLESSTFNDRYTLRVVDDQDDIALYELFSPPFVLRLSTEMRIFWQQCGSDLVVWANGHEKEAADLDRMCLEGWHVLHRYLEEHR